VAPPVRSTVRRVATGRYQQRVGGLECAIGVGNVGRYDDAIRLAQRHDLGLPAEQNQLVRGLKGTTFEGGIRVPCMVRWPGVLPKGTVTEQAAMTIDLTASMLRVAGAHGLPGQMLDGIDILEQLRQSGPEQARIVFWRQRRGENAWRAVRDGNLKLVTRRQGSQTQEYLFDLGRDPAEENNLLSSRPEDVARLKRLLADWEREVRDHR